MDSKQFSKFMELQKEMMGSLIEKMKETSHTPTNGTCPSSQEGTTTTVLTHFEPFDPEKESFTNYKLRFENYLELKNLSNNKSQCTRLLLNSIGAKNFDMVCTLVSPSKPTELEFDCLIKLIEDYLSPKRNYLVAQHQFLSTYQENDQSLSSFVLKLKQEVTDCNFICPCSCQKSIADVFLRAQFIRGLKDDNIREKILQSKSTDFKDIVSEAITLEASKLNCRILSQSVTNVTPPTVDINKVSYNNFKPIAKYNKQNHLDLRSLGLDKMCLRCGRTNHLSNNCRTDRSKLKCSSCGKSGHVAKVCISSVIKNIAPRGSTNQIQSGSTTCIEGSSDTTPSDPSNTDSLCSYGISHVVDVFQNNSQSYTGTERYYVNVKIEGKSVKFEVDSGSAFTFIPEDQFNRLNLSIPLQPSALVFRSYTQNTFVPRGKITVTVNCNDIDSREEMYVVPNEFSPILGRVWIRHLNINLNSVDKQQSTNTTLTTVNNISEIKEIVSLFPDVFTERIGCVPGYEVTLKLRDGATPVFHREREVPYALTEKVENELSSLEATGIISKTTHSDWGSPLVVIPKADGGVRLCVDYKIGVNERLVNSHYPIKKIDEILNSLQGSRFFCRLDLFKAYLHIKVDDKSSEIQTITTHRGTYKMNRLSFGIKTAPAEFNRIMDQILRDVPKTEYYFDDILVHGSTREECVSNLKRCLGKLQEYDLHLNCAKCSFLQEEIDFLGHKVKYNCILKSPSKINAILDMPRPRSVDSLRRFLGMVTYYSRFIHNMSSITAPLRKLLKTNVEYNWTNEQETSFLKLKKDLSSDQVLMPFNPKLPVQLACDAGPDGVAGILSHIIGGEEYPIAFASRALTIAEKGYSQLDREALAIVFSVTHFYQYLFGRHFTLVTDNQPLVRIFHQHSPIPKMTSARLQRYAAFLSGFNYSVTFKKGIENSNVDCLSRLPIATSKTPESEINEEVKYLCESSVFQIGNLTLTYQNLKEETRKDTFLSDMLLKLQESRVVDSEFTIEGGILFRGPRVVVPKSMQAEVLKELHLTHIGVTKMKQLARRYVYWRSIDKDIEKLVRECPECASVRGNPPKAPIHPWMEPEHNWQRVHVDYAGQFQGHYFLVLVDAKSKWAEIIPCKTAPTSTKTIELLQEIFSRNGFPDVMVSDNSSVFTSGEFQTFCKTAGIFQKFIAPGHPATNGLAERNIQTLKHRLTAMTNEPIPMQQKIQKILFRYRATPLQCGKTPSELFFNRQIRITLDALKPTILAPMQENENELTKKKARQLKVGERVQARYYANNKETWKPGVITRKLGQLHYKVILEDGFSFKRHINQLRKFNQQSNKEQNYPPLQSATMTPRRSLRLQQNS